MLVATRGALPSTTGCNGHIPVRYYHSLNAWEFRLHLYMLWSCETTKMFLTLRMLAMTVSTHCDGFAGLGAIQGEGCVGNYT